MKALTCALLAIACQIPSNTEHTSGPIFLIASVVLLIFERTRAKS